MKDPKEQPRPPLPVRESAGESVTVPEPTDEPGEPKLDVEDGAEAPKVAGTDGDRRPTPVRMVMETEDEPESASAGPERTRTFRDPASGQEWTADAIGWSMSGVLPLRTVPILEIVFRSSGPESPPERRVVHQGGDLASFSEAELVDLLARSEAYREPSREVDPQRSNSRKSRRKPPRG